MTLSEFFKSRGIEEFTEGHCQQRPDEIAHLIELTKRPNVSVMEIGFNAGHSAEIFLKNNPTLSLVSFDIGCHGYVSMGKQYIDVVFPRRHTLILGNSIFSVPHYISEHPNKKFDVIFVDGCHDYEIARADLQNCMNLAHKDTIVIMDDTIHHHPEWETVWTTGPTQAWKEFVTDKKITELATHDYDFGRGASWGKYNL